MANTSDSNDGGPIIGRNRKQIIEAWNEGKSLRQISQETVVPIQEVKQCLKESQKAFVERGVKSHAKKNNP